MRNLNVLTGLVVLLLASACGSKSCNELQAELNADLQAARGINEMREVVERYEGKTCTDESGQKRQLVRQ